MDGNIFAVYTKEDKNIGMCAIAEKIPKSNNLVSYFKRCVTFNVCDTWKEVKEIEKNWNIGFLKNGKQKHYSEW